MANALHRSVILAMALTVSPALAHDTDVITQYSTLDALKAGLFDGDMSYGEMAEYGDFGVGTFNALDGEMVGFDGRFWRITQDGVVSEVTPETQTPFAVMTFFDRDITFDLPHGSDFKTLSGVLNAHLTSANTPVAIMITGTFDTLTVRAPRHQEEPYLPLAEALADQAVWHLENASGTMAGYWFPAWLGNINAPVWHLHYLSDDHTTGGHVVELTAGSGIVALDPSPRLTILLPQNGTFDEADLTPP